MVEPDRTMLDRDDPAGGIDQRTSLTAWMPP
jgi:hypothetical protein